MSDVSVIFPISNVLVVSSDVSSVYVTEESTELVSSNSSVSLEVLVAQTNLITSAEQGPTGATGERGPSGNSSVITHQLIDVPIGGHRMVVLINGVAVYADPSNAAHCSRLIGMTTSATAAGGFAEIQNYGEIEEPSWSLTVNAPVYLGANGIPTQIVPAFPNAVFLQVIGFASATNRIFLNQLQPVTLSG